MKNFFLFPIALFLIVTTLAQPLNAQKSYRVKIQKKSSGIVKGRLLYATGDSIGILENNLHKVQLKMEDVQSIKIHRKGNVGRGALIGAGLGTVLGATIGYMSYEPPVCTGLWMCWDFGPEYDAMSGGGIGLIAGTIVGTIIGAASEKEIIIDGDVSRFDFFKTQYELTSPTIQSK